MPLLITDITDYRYRESHGDASWRENTLNIVDEAFYWKTSLQFQKKIILHAPVSRDSNLVYLYQTKKYVYFYHTDRKASSLIL